MYIVILWFSDYSKDALLIVLSIVCCYSVDELSTNAEDKALQTGSITKGSSILFYFDFYR